jgi:hypothetical protein
VDCFSLIGLVLIALFNFLLFIRKINRPWYLIWGLVFYELSLWLYHPIPIYLLINTVTLGFVAYGALREPP